MDNSQKIKKAAEKVTKTYKAWIEAGAEYNILISGATGVMGSYTIKWQGKPRKEAKQ